MISAPLIDGITDSPDISAAAALAFKNRVLADGGTFEAQACLAAQITVLRNAGFYNLASLILTPNGYKANKVYSIKPTTGAGDFATTRAGTATRKSSSLGVDPVATGVPRLDYTLGTCPVLLSEPQRTNLALRSEELGDAVWTKDNITISANSTTSPDGISTADAVLETVANLGHSLWQIWTKAASALQYTLSLYVKPNGRDWFKFNIDDNATGGWSVWFNVTTGTVGTNQQEGAAGFSFQRATITATTNGFYRCSVTFTTNAGAGLRLIMYNSTNGVATTYVGDITKGFYVWGAQLELGSYATSYIPTTSATVTRITDAFTPLAAAALIGQSQGTFFADFEYPALGQNVTLLEVSDTTNNERILIDVTTNLVRGFVIDGGVTGASLSSSAIAIGRHKVALVYRLNYVALFVDGVKIGEDLTVTIPATTTIYFSNTAGSVPFYGGQYVAALAQVLISDAAAILLTTL